MNVYADDPPAPNAYYTVHHELAVYCADIATDCNNWVVPHGTPPEPPPSYVAIPSAQRKPTAGP